MISSENEFQYLNLNPMESNCSQINEFSEGLVQSNSNKIIEINQKPQQLKVSNQTLKTKKYKGIRQKKLTNYDDQKILRLVQKFGPKFHIIARYFPKNFLNKVKNRYYKVLRYKQDQFSEKKQQELSVNKDNCIEEASVLLENANLNIDLKFAMVNCLNKVNEILNFMKNTL